MRVVHGLPFLWEPIVATFPHKVGYDVAAWSPCNRFIALAGPATTKIAIVDAVTLEQLDTFESPCHIKYLSFSPDGRWLTQFSGQGLTGWDLQTGGPVGTTSEGDEFLGYGFSSTYSTDGKMIAVAYWGATVVITVYNLLPMTHVNSYTVQEGHIMPPIWTHGECIRFITLESGTFSIWEVGFSSVNPPAEVESFLLSDEMLSTRKLVVLPTLSRLAFALPQNVLILGPQDSRLPLEFVDREEFFEMSFSSDGRFFLCVSRQRLHVWKESPVGYTLHQNLVLGGALPSPSPYFSPNGESIVMVLRSTVIVWPTGDPIIPQYSVPDPSFNPRHFLPEFSPDKTLAAVIRPKERKVIILDLVSGNPRLVVEVGMEISCVRVTGSTVVVASCEKLVAWDIPARDSALIVGANINDSIHTTTFDDSARPPAPSEPSTYTYVSISPNLKHVAIERHTANPTHTLSLYDMWNGKYLTSATMTTHLKTRFAPNGRELWRISPILPLPERWEIIEESNSSPTKLKPLETVVCPYGTHSWHSAYGYRVTDDGWVLGPTKMRLLWLPPYWRPNQIWKGTWQGRFFGFLHGEESVILEFFE